MQILLRSVITGFGLKLGGDIYKLVTSKLGFSTDSDDTDLLETRSKSDDSDSHDDDADDDEVDNELQGWHVYLGDFGGEID